ncbi:hypothetical protein D0S48_18790 [Psychrobacillus sp. AK 1817]|uniref:hypothetical protein n=1 Tax=Psychrobacillus sp. AK 1817 TaxID=2303505 RepID=UPI00124551E5|nr:hypothetical protein [Psychrobacillus sp. AK 1817]QEY22541.1 hypothetical protein D0S48_18790 [Psychrobacillus sp. AK 1817]
MVLTLQAFTTPANTQVIADTAALPGTLPTPAVPTAPAMLSPLIDGSSAYIWSPNTASNQTVTFQSIFDIGTLPILGLALPLSTFYAYAGNETVSVTATLEVVNLLGIVIATIPLFTDANSGSSQDVAIASGDALLAVGLLGNTGRIVINATVTSPTVIGYSANPGRYLGQLTVRSLIAV